ncbi:MAG TPA: hypothetical protein VNI58_10730, partial [Mariprofundaceae bacterium]|nr:hypothetical protein [Mariprofundaceae bacterium]
MPQTHLSIRSLIGDRRPDKDVQALFAVNPNRKAILFIHGYSGDIGTWSDFNLLIPGNEYFSGYDVYFYLYDGIRAELYASAALFRDFLG